MYRANKGWHQTTQENTTVQMKAAPASNVAWRTSKRWLEHLEQRGEVLRIARPVDVQFEAGAIADLLVKNDGPAVVFE